MFNFIHCIIPQRIKRQQDKNNTHFIQTVLEEKRRVKVLHNQGIQMTAENPRIRNQEETTDISIELRLKEMEQTVKQKRRRQLSENSQELRVLHKQLRTAFVAKQLAEQKVDLQRKKEESFKTKCKEDAEIENERLRIKDIMKGQDILQRRKREVFRSVLQSQIEEKLELRQQHNENVKCEHEIMQQLQRSLDEKRIAELEELERQKEKAKKEIQEFVCAQENFKMQLRTQYLNKNIHFWEIERSRDEEQFYAQNEKKKEREQKQALSERIGRHLLQVENEKRRREDQLLDLLVEERKAKEDQRFQHNNNKQLVDRINVCLEMDQYRMNTRHHKTKKQEEDYHLRAEQRRILAEHNNLEKLALEFRKHKVQQHGSIIQQIIEEKIQQRSVDAAAVFREFEFLSNNENIRENEIKKERIRLLSKEQREVLGYLPANVLRESDRQYLGLPSNQ